MKLAIVVTSLGLGGTEQWVEWAACGMATRGHSVDVFYGSPPEDRSDTLRQAGVGVHCYGGSLQQLEKLLSANRPDWAHLNVWEDLFGHCAAAAAAGCRVALTYHSVPNCNPKQWAYRLYRRDNWRRFRYEAEVLRRCTRAVVGCGRVSARGILGAPAAVLCPAALCARATLREPRCRWPDRSHPLRATET